MISEIFVSRKVFRNVNHAIWFFMSMWLLALTIAYYFYPSLKLIILLPILVHGTALLEAIYTVYIKRKRSVTLSRDCIWFNTFMVLVHVSIFFAFHFSN